MCLKRGRASVPTEQGDCVGGSREAVFTGCVRMVAPRGHSVVTRWSRALTALLRVLKRESEFLRSLVVYPDVK